ncbi:MAG TPA: 23S rRNA (uracil(1939)-C(5))-methyltransferase RlmD [Steroidobacteraceae bacterium]|nr:23S rRNA (uracil(1939)-C(5))-methyltransferase RlmD [Steroidobacteraceae bacterium]
MSRADRRAGAAAAEETGSISGLTQEGEGVVHGGKTAFVAGALPGERVRFRRRARRRQHDEAELLEVLEPSPARVSPRCVHFGVCGGCVLQHLEGGAQVTAKDAQLRAALARVARVEPARWLAPLSGPSFGYRRRARLGARFVYKKARVVVGFRERAAPYVAELTGCEVLAAPAGALLAPLAALVGALSIREHLPQIEVAVADNATALVLRVLREPTAADLAQLRAFAAAHQVQLYLQRAGVGSVAPLEPQAAELTYALPAFGLTFGFAPTDFIQVNAAVNAALVARALELLELTPTSRVLDLFCGLGNFTLPLARHAAQVTGVEGEAALIARARANAQRNGIGNAEFHVADLTQAVHELPWMRASYSHVLLDPPRTGARELLGALARLAPRRLLYISCHPGSLARDLGVLVHEHGMRLEAAGVVDMFPHTAHVESVALLSALPAQSRSGA